MDIFYFRIIFFTLLILFSDSIFSNHSEIKITEESGKNETGLHWYEQPLRILQTVLREPDGKNYDAESVIQYMKDTHSNVLVINAGGIIDFFNNPLPAANINQFFDEHGDVLRDIVAAAHQEGFKVIARVDFRGVEKKIYEQYPEWFAQDVSGEPITLTYTRVPLYAPCYESYYRSKHGLNFIAHLFEEYDIDGIWHNAVHVREICYCDDCKTLYLDATGSEIPVSGDSSKAEMDRYYNWKIERASNHMQSYRNKIKEYGDSKAYAAEVFGMYDVSLPISSGIDLYSGRDHFDFLVSVNFLTENRRDIEYKNLGSSASLIRFLKALDPNKQPVILFGQNGTSHRYIMEPEVDSRIFLWQAVASGGGIWNCSFTGQHPGVTYDRRNAFLLSDFNKFIKDHAHYFRSLVPSADLKIYYSRSTRTHFGSDNPADDGFGASIQGIERMSRDNHIQYGFLPDEDLSLENLSKVKVLMMPNVASLSDQEIVVLKEYVENGGNLIATFKTSLHDEFGNKRDDFGLSELFGVSYSGVTVDTHMDSYQWIHDYSLILHERMKETSMLINSGETVLTTLTNDQAKAVAGYIPMIRNQPPEMGWIPEVEMVTDHPTLVVNKFGKGKVVYFANQPGRMNHLMGHNDFSDLLSGAVKFLLDGQQLIQTNAPSSVNVWVNESKDEGEKRYTISLVNVTGGPERPLRSITPVYDIEVTVNLPNDSPWDSKILREESEIETLQNGNSMTIKIGRLDEFVSILITEK